MVTDKRETVKDSKGRNHGIILLVPQNSTTRSEVFYKSLQSEYPDSNKEPRLYST